MKRRHEPVRTCLGCGARDKQRSMLRLVARRDGELRLARKEKGRGGYLHQSQECWQGFVRKKRLYRALHVEIGREAKERLIEVLRQQERD